MFITKSKKKLLEDGKLKINVEYVNESLMNMNSILSLVLYDFRLKYATSFVLENLDL
jgi:hypothetical protein